MATTPPPPVLVGWVTIGQSYLEQADAYPVDNFDRHELRGQRESLLVIYLAQGEQEIYLIFLNVSEIAERARDGEVQLYYIHAFPHSKKINPYAAGC